MKPSLPLVSPFTHAARRLFRMRGWLALCAVALFWCQSAFAITSACDIALTSPSFPSLYGYPGTSQTFTFDVTEFSPGDCGGNASGTITVDSADSTGGTTLSSGTFSAAGGTSVTITVFFGPTGGGNTVVHVNCTGGCYGGTGAFDINVYTSTVYSLTPTGNRYDIVGNQLQPTRLGVKFDINGSPATDELIGFYEGTSVPALAVSSASFLNLLGTDTTDSLGRASISHLFQTPGNYTITAGWLCDGLCQTVEMNLVVEPVAVTPVSPASGTQDVASGTSSTLAARLGSQSIPAFAGTPMTWSIVSQPTGGDGSLSGSTNTDSNGETTTKFVATVPGAYLVEARSDCSYCATPAYQFTVNVQAAASTGSLTIVSGDGQAGLVGTAAANPLVVALLDGAGAPVSGQAVSWSIVSGDATVTPSSNTDASGHASATLTFGATPGPIVVQASALSGTLTTTFHAASSAGNSLVIVSGDGQARLAGTVADDPLVVALLDGSGTPLSGETVSWSIISGDATVTPSSDTDATGHASATLTFGLSPGPVVVRASALAGSLTVDFSETSANANSLVIIGGDGQAAGPGATLAQPLAVRIVAPSGVTSTGRSAKPQALSGIPVTWTVLAGGGSVSSATTLTDANGDTSVQYTLGSTPGINSIQASVLGATAVFSVTTSAPTTGSLTIVSGNQQSLAPGVDSAPLVVMLSDGGGNPISGATVNWTASSATLSSSSSVTGADGKASVVAKASTVGVATVTASSESPASDPVQFSLNASLSNLSGLSEKDRAIAIVLDNACPALAMLTNRSAGQQDLYEICQELGQVDPQSAIDAISELFPDFGIALADASLMAAQSQFQNLKARIAALRAGTQGNSFGGLAIYSPLGNIPVTGLIDALVGQDGNSQEAGAGFDRWGYFVSGTIGRGKADPGRTTPAFDYDINGLTAGVDYRKSDKLIFGGAVGYTKQSTDLRGQIGKLDTKGWSISGYSTFYKESSWYSDLVLTYGHNTYDTARQIRFTLVTPSGTNVIDQVARSSSSGSMFEGALTFGHDFQKNGWSISPYGRALYTRLNFGSTSERLDLGAGLGLGVQIDARDVSSLSSQVGAKFAFAHSADWGILMPHLQFEWEHEFRDDPQSLTARFLNDPTATPIHVEGDRQDSDFFRVGLGLSMVMTHGRSGFLLYERMVARSGYSQDSLALGFRIEF